jgi:hypothetical protein
MPLNKAEREALWQSAALPDEVFELLANRGSDVTVKRNTVGGQVITRVSARMDSKTAREIVELMPAATDLILEGKSTVGIEIVTQNVTGDGKRPFFVDGPRPKNYGKPLSFMTRCAAALRTYGWVSKTEADESTKIATYQRATDPTLATMPEDEEIAVRALNYWLDSETVSSPREKRIKQAVLQDVVVESTAPFCAVAVNWIWRRLRTGQQIDDFVSGRAARVDLCRRAGCPERRTVGVYCAEHATTPVDLRDVFGNIGALPPNSAVLERDDPPPRASKKASTRGKATRTVEREMTMQVAARRRVVLKPKGS